MDPAIGGGRQHPRDTAMSNRNRAACGGMLRETPPHTVSIVASFFKLNRNPNAIMSFRQRGEHTRAICHFKVGLSF